VWQSCPIFDLLYIIFSWNLKLHIQSSNLDSCSNELYKPSHELYKPSHELYKPSHELYKPSHMNYTSQVMNYTSQVINYTSQVIWIIQAKSYELYKPSHMNYTSQVIFVLQILFACFQPFKKKFCLSQNFFSHDYFFFGHEKSVKKNSKYYHNFLLKIVGSH
jgi:hypothetical protein